MATSLAPVIAAREQLVSWLLWAIPHRGAAELLGRICDRAGGAAAGGRRRGRRVADGHLPAVGTLEGASDRRNTRRQDSPCLRSFLPGGSLAHSIEGRVWTGSLDCEVDCRIARRGHRGPERERQGFNLLGSVSPSARVADVSDRSGSRRAPDRAPELSVSKSRDTSADRSQREADRGAEK